MIHTQFHNHGQYPGVVTIIPVEGTSYRTGRVRVSHLGGKAHQDSNPHWLVLCFPHAFWKIRINLHFLFYLTETLCVTPWTSFYLRTSCVFLMDVFWPREKTRRSIPWSAQIYPDCFPELMDGWCMPQDTKSHPRKSSAWMETLRTNTSKDIPPASCNDMPTSVGFLWRWAGLLIKEGLCNLKISERFL